MVFSLSWLCLVVALICFGLAAAGVPAKLNLTDIGLAFLTISFLVR